MHNDTGEGSNINMDLGSVLKGAGIIIGSMIIIGLIGLLLFFMGFVCHVDRHELGFSYDRMTGDIETRDRYGWWIRMPIRYSVHTIDMRPYQISISANQRILNAKLVRFDPKGLEQFIAWHGRSAGDGRNNMLEILKCYAFDITGGTDCPFLEVVSEIAPPQGGTFDLTRSNIVTNSGFSRR